MVDQKARREYAQLVRQFISGRMTNDEYEQRFFGLRASKKDPALLNIFNGVDALCENARPDKMMQQWRLNNDEQRCVAQAVLFLQSDQEYGWPMRLWDGSVFLITAFCILLIFALNPEISLITRSAISVPLVVLWRYYERWQGMRFERAGDAEAWPFLHQVDLEEAKRPPLLLNGRGNNAAGTMS